MATRAVKYYPRARFYRNEVTHPAFDYEIYTNEIIALARARAAAQGETDQFARAARLGGCTWVGIDARRLEAEGDFDFENIDPPALICDYKVEWRDTRAGRDWFYNPTAKEEAYRALRRAEYEAELDELNAQETKDDEDLVEIATLENLLAQLSDGGAGYLETSFNWTGATVEGIFWGLGVPNIPVEVYGPFLNGGVSLRLKRLEPPTGQADFNFEICLGETYSLIIGGDGNSAEFVHYRVGVDDAVALRGELEAIKDNGRLTPDDQQQILDWHLDIQEIRNAAKARGTGNSKPTADESAQIEAIKSQINSLRDSKRGLTEADQNRKREIEDLLVVDSLSFALQEASRSLIGQPVDITFLPLESGSVVIHVGDERKVYENKEWQKDKPDDAPYPPHNIEGELVIKSDGGKWGMLFGDVYHVNGEAETPSFPIPFEPDENELLWSLNATAPAMTELEARLEQVRAPQIEDGIQQDGLYRIVVTLNAQNQSRTPEFYGVELYIPALIDAEETELWNSQTDGANMNANSGNHIVDVLMQSDRTRGRLCKLHINNAANIANLMKNLGGAAGDVTLLDVETTEEKVLQRFGKVMVNAQPALNDLTDSGGTLTTDLSIANEAEIELSGVAGFLDKEIAARFACNGLLVNDALRSYARDAGLPPERYAGIPDAEVEGLAMIKPGRIGRPFTVKPSEGTRYWDWMQQLVRDHAPRWELWENEEGLQLTRRLHRVRDDLAYTTSGEASSHLRFRRKAEQAGGLALRQDTRDYFTGCTVYGAKDPLTGKRFEATETIPQATDERFENSVFYTGEENHFTASANDALESEAACRLAAREFLNITPLTPNGLPPWYLEGTIDYDESVRDGDLPTVNGIKFLSDAVFFAALNAGDGQQMSLSLRLAEDKALATIMEEP